MIVNPNDPAEILPNALYLGSASTATKKELLQSKGIKAILNVTPHRPNMYPEDFKYMKVQIIDDHLVKISAHFDKAIDFISECINQNLPVFVHCEAGISRSSTLVISYLVAKNNMTLQDAYSHVRAKRPVIAPNIGFMQQLIEHEIKIHSKPTISINDYFIASIEEIGYERPDIEKAMELHGLDSNKVLNHLMHD